MFAANLAAFDASLRPVEAVIASIRRRYPGAPVAYTERVPGYLLQAAGLTVVTPPGFAAAIENGNDPSPGDTAQMFRLITGHKAKVLLYNAQATSPVTQQVRALARQSGVPGGAGHRDHAAVLPQLPGLAARPGHGPARRARRGEMTGSGGAAVALRGATLRFGHHVIWENLDLDIAPGECLAILGPNGAGKTTLLKVLLGLLPLSAGTVTIDGRAPPARQRADRVRPPAAGLRP